MWGKEIPECSKNSNRDEGKMEMKEDWYKEWVLQQSYFLRAWHFSWDQRKEEKSARKKMEQFSRPLGKEKIELNPLEENGLDHNYHIWKDVERNDS